MYFCLFALNPFSFILFLSLHFLFTYILVSSYLTYVCLFSIVFFQLSSSLLHCFLFLNFVTSLSLFLVSSSFIPSCSLLSSPLFLSQLIFSLHSQSLQSPSEKYESSSRSRSSGRLLAVTDRHSYRQHSICRVTSSDMWLILYLLFVCVCVSQRLCDTFIYLTGLSSHSVWRCKQLLISNPEAKVTHKYHA